MNFKEWCIKTDHVEYIDDWDYDKNQICPDEISYGSKREVYIKCHRRLHESTCISLEKLIRRKKCICSKCNSFAQHIIDEHGEDYLWKIWSPQNIISPYDISYSSLKNVLIKCLINKDHGEYPVVCNSYTSRMKTGCPKCHVRKITQLSHDSLAEKYPKSKDVWGESNMLSPYEVTASSHRVIMWKCDKNIHSDYRRSISETVRYEFRCPSCSAEKNESILQTKVREYLIELGYTVLNEYKCNIIPERPWVRNNRFMPFDNEVEELRLIIEVHGKQHYHPNSWHQLTAERNGTSQEYEFRQQQSRDKFKMEYALLRGYHYLVIPYTSEQDEHYKQLINNKIREITTKESVTTTA